MAEIRESLQVTHAQLSSAHAAELDSLKAERATLLADSNAEYESKLLAIKEELESVKIAAEHGSKGLEEAVKARAEAEEKAKTVQGELEIAKKALADAEGKVKSPGKKKDGEEVERLKRVIEGLKGDLEGHNEVSRTPFQSSHLLDDSMSRFRGLSHFSPSYSKLCRETRLASREMKKLEMWD